MNRKTISSVVGFALLAGAAFGWLAGGFPGTGQRATSEALAAEADASEVPAGKQVTLAFTVNNIGFLGTCG